MEKCFFTRRSSHSVLLQAVWAVQNLYPIRSLFFIGSEEIAVFEVDFLWHRYVLQDSRAKIAALTYIIRTKSLLNEIW